MIEQDPLDLKVPNISFSLVNKISGLTKEDKIKYKNQRITRGFDYTELWNLDGTIAKFILPRLIAFKDAIHHEPSMYKELDKMILAFEELSKEDYVINGVISKGLKSFIKHFDNLWI